MKKFLSSLLASTLLLSQHSMVFAKQYRYCICSWRNLFSYS